VVLEVPLRKNQVNKHAFVNWSQARIPPHLLAGSSWPKGAGMCRVMAQIFVCTLECGPKQLKKNPVSCAAGPVQLAT